MRAGRWTTHTVGAAPRHVQPFLDWLLAEAAAHEAPRATRRGRAKRARPG